MKDSDMHGASEIKSTLETWLKGHLHEGDGECEHEEGIILLLQAKER
jgi:hypothetical protein